MSILITILYLHEGKRDGICQATCSQVGNYIGAMSIGLAERCYTLIVWTEIFMNAGMMLILTTHRRQIANFYAPDDMELNRLI